MRCNYLHFEFWMPRKQRTRESTHTHTKFEGKRKTNARLFQLNTFTRNERAMQMWSGHLYIFLLINHSLSKQLYDCSFHLYLNCTTPWHTMWSASYFISGWMPHNQFQLHNNSSLNGSTVWVYVCICMCFLSWMLHFMSLLEISIGAEMDKFRQIRALTEMIFS